MWLTLACPVVFQCTGSQQSHLMLQLLRCCLLYAHETDYRIVPMSHRNLRTNRTNKTSEWESVKSTEFPQIEAASK